MYSDVFCKVYNEFGWNYYPEAFGQQLLLWLKEQNRRPQTALDLACGTGVLCRILREAGMEVRGMDYSEGMIRIAREADCDIPYDVADMTIYAPDARFDLVTCTGDALNHIRELSQVEKIFQNVYGYLSPGGCFVFDLLNAQEVSTSEPFEMDYDARTKVWFQMTKPGPDQVNLQIRVFEEGKEQFIENIRERIYAPEVICGLLEKTGFQVTRCADRLLEDGGHGTTWFIVAEKEAAYGEAG